MACVANRRLTAGLCLTVMLFCAGVALGSTPFKIQSLEILREDEGTGKTIFTVHLLPGESKKFDKVEYIIVYHQDFPFEDSRGNKYHKIHEPGRFKYTLKKAKFVADLDNYVNFRVPTSRERLKVIYGQFAFNPKYPITEPRLEILAYDGSEVVWKGVFRTDRTYIWDEKEGKLVEKPPKKKPAPAAKSK